MLSTLMPVLFALFHMAMAAPTPNSHTNPSAPLLQKRLETGPIVALSICIPGAALVIGLGVGIMALYPKQRRKLRALNAGRDVGFAEVMSGRVAPQPPPVYKEHEGSEHELETRDATPQPEARVAPQHHAAPQLPPDVRHAALAV